jgi:twitching motility two-component system response regulator PilG
MRLEFDSNTPALSVAETAAEHQVNEAGSAKTREMLQEGIKAAQAGNRAEARHLLLKVTEVEPGNENAWLWLASISEYPEELLVFLKNVLDINPGNERAQQWTKATRSLLAKTFVQRGIDATKEDQKEFANQCFNHAIAQDEENELAWLWMASVTDSDEEKLTYLEKALSLDPENEDARRAVAAVWERFAEARLEAAYSAAAQGDHNTANENLDQLLEKFPESEEGWLLRSDLTDDPAEKTALLEKVLSINPDNEDALAAVESLKQEVVKVKLRTATEAAIEGDREKAAGLVEELLAGSPELEEAWVLKSQLAEGPEEKAAAFEKVLEINPSNEEALSGLESLKQETVKTKLQAANVAAIEGNREKAASLLDEVLSASPDMEEAWVLRSHLAENFDDKIRAFEKVLELNPGNLAAQAGLESLNAIIQSVAPDVPEEKDAPVVEEARFDTEADKEDASPVEVAHEDQLVPAEGPRLENEVAEDRNPTQELELPEGLRENSPFAAEPVPETESYTHLDSPEGSFPPDYSFGEDPWPTEDNLEEVSDTVEELYPQGDQNENSSSPEGSVPELSEEKEPVVLAESESEAEASGPWNSSPGPTVYDNVQPDNEVAESDYSEESYHSAETESFESADLAGDEGPAAADENEEAGEYASQPQSEGYFCPFCDAENDLQAYVCKTCFAMLSLSDLEMLLAHQQADRDIVDFAVEQMEAERGKRDLDEYELKALGIGHLNLKNFEKGLAYLQESQRLNPNDVLLGGQINALSIRLAEIRAQAEVHDSMVKGKTILVVDDSATVRKLIAGKLEKSGHEVVCAVDGVDALEKIEDMVPDLILLDINMPRMDGYQVCKLIRNNHATENVPVVMISGKDGFFDKVRGRMSGTTGYITKPFGPETLMKALETYIKNDAPEPEYSEE